MDRKNYCLNKISDASSHLLGVINDILDMSKIEANKFELSPVNFNFEKMLQKVVNVVNFKIDEKKQNFLVNIDPKIPRFLISDDQRLAQVITNLLSNALKFTPEHGAIRLNTKFLREESEYCTIQFEVIDSGIGITEEQKPRLFNSFEQAESGTSRKFGGTGLGLAISKRIVEMMNGRIWVESAWGEGSSFSFTIQAKRGEESPGRRLNPGVNLNTLRILVADDDPEVREYLAHLMEQFRISCDIAAGAEEALALVEKNGPYDMYLVDWKMPGMNGIDLSRKIKKQGSGTSIIIMISATELRDIEDDAKDAGVDRFLAKPIFPSMILDAINECLGTESLLDSGNSTMEVTDNFEGRRILLVEDVEINRELVQTLLEPTLLRIDCAENGRMAVEMFRAAPEAYDMIFMDVQMPEMDGYEATRKIRQFEKARNAPGVFPQQGEESERLSESPQGEKSMEFLETPKRLWESPQGIPIIAMTANVFQEDIQKCLQAGMNGHVGKPIDFSDVLAKLRTYLPPKET
jgi:CheY-like chemotaxis protein